MEHSEQRSEGIAIDGSRRKWEERLLIEAIRERGYEPDEIVIRSDDRA